MIYAKGVCLEKEVLSEYFHYHLFSLERIKKNVQQLVIMLRKDPSTK